MNPFLAVKKKTQKTKNINKKLVVVVIDKKIKGVSRLHTMVIANANEEQLGDFMKTHIDPIANITTVKWTVYKPLKEDFENLTCLISRK